MKKEVSLANVLVFDSVVSEFDVHSRYYVYFRKIKDITLKTYREQWRIETGGERGSGRSLLVARHDDDDDDGK